MRSRLAIVLLVVFGLAACSQYTCPTYTKHELEKKEIDGEKERV